MIVFTTQPFVACVCCGRGGVSAGFEVSTILFARKDAALVVDM